MNLFTSRKISAAHIVATPPLGRPEPPQVPAPAPTQLTYATQPQVRCAVCQTHKRPLYVPWHQHALGCAVRACVLEAGFAAMPPLGAAPRDSAAAHVG
jgi:hypothetical protein